MQKEKKDSSETANQFHIFEEVKEIVRHQVLRGVTGVLKLDEMKMQETMMCWENSKV